MNLIEELRGPMPMYHTEERAIRTKAADEIERLQEAKRRFSDLADERGKESNALRQLLRDARDHVPWDVLKRIDAALAVEQT